MGAGALGLALRAASEVGKTQIGVGFAAIRLIGLCLGLPLVPGAAVLILVVLTPVARAARAIVLAVFAVSRALFLAVFPICHKLFFHRDQL